MKTCFLYYRVSTQRQVDTGVSLDNQLATLKTYARNNGMKIIGIYEDAGVSGKNITDRQALRALLADIQDKTKHTPDYVLVFKLSRLGRNVLDVLSIIQTFNQHGVVLKCIADQFDLSGQTGKLMCSILATVAEIERDNIREQSLACRHYIAKNGGWNSGFAPYGYLLVDHKIIVYEPLRNQIQFIFTRYLEGAGYNTIAKELNELGEVKWQNKNCTLKLFSWRAIKRIIENPIYAGYIKYGDIIAPGKHEAIISKDDWQRVQERLKLNKDLQVKGNNKFLLVGLIICPVCGHPLCGSTDTSHRIVYYRCRWHKYQTGQARCTFNKCVRADRIEKEVIKYIKRLDLKAMLNSSDIQSELTERQARVSRLNERLLECDDPLLFAHLEGLLKNELTKITELNKDLVANKIKVDRLSVIQKRGHKIIAEDVRCLISSIEIWSEEQCGSWIKCINKS